MLAGLFLSVIQEAYYMSISVSEYVTAFKLKIPTESLGLIDTCAFLTKRLPEQLNESKHGCNHQMGRSLADNSIISAKVFMEARQLNQVNCSSLFESRDWQDVLLVP